MGSNTKCAAAGPLNEAALEPNGVGVTLVATPEVWVPKQCTPAVLAGCCPAAPEPGAPAAIPDPMN